MSLDKIVHGIGNLTRTAAIGGLLGLSILGTGSMPAYAQQNVKYATNPVKYVPCTSQKTTNEGLSPGELLTMLGVMAGSSEKPETQDLGVALSTLGAMRHQKEVAREGRAQVNINQGGGRQEAARYVPAPGCVWANPENPDDFSVMERLGVGFAANYWRDFTKKGLNKALRGKRNLSEFAEIKNRFYPDENIFLAIKGTMKGKTRLEIYDPERNKLHEVSWNCGDYFKAPCLLLTFGSDFDLTGWLIKNGGYGSYTAKWSSSKGKGEVTKFEIVPASERLEKQ